MAHCESASILWHIGRERERKLLAHNAALQSSTEELGRKIQLKVCACTCMPTCMLMTCALQHDESSKRYDQQLEQKKKLATGVISSRHTSAEQPPRVEAYKTKKWCNVCNVEVRVTLHVPPGQSHVQVEGGGNIVVGQEMCGMREHGQYMPMYILSHVHACTCTCTWPHPHPPT